MKAILIDATMREIRALEYTDYKDLRRMVGGLLTIATDWPSGNVLFVDDEGLLKPQMHFFRIAGRDQPLPGNGVVVGADRHDEKGDYLGTEDPQIAVEQLQAEVTFLSRAQADSWAKANASEPAIRLITQTPDGIEEHVIAHFGQVFAKSRDAAPTAGSSMATCS